MEEMLYSLDRFVDETAVLVNDSGESCFVPAASLPVGACEGKMYRKVGEIYIEDLAAEQARRERVQALQNRLRRRKK